MTGIVKHAAQTVARAIADRAAAKAPMPDLFSIGAPISRVDAHLKVTGAATYPSDVQLSGMTHAAIVTSAIARGRITAIDAEAARALPGVIAVFTHQNCPRLHRNLIPQIGAGRWSIGRDLRPLQDDRVRFAGQPVALVVAETLEQASAAASRVHVAYAEEPANTDLAAALDDAHPAKPRLGKPDYARGDAQTASLIAPVRIEAEYATPPQTNNPLGLFATVAAWEGDRLILYDANQFTRNVEKSAAKVLGIESGDVEVRSPFVGGGFGAGLRAWPHTWLAAMAAREVGRPVKLVLPRAQMFTAVGRRAQTIQQVVLGAERDGTLTAMSHHATHDVSRDEEFVEALGTATRMLYACPNVETRYRVAEVDRSTPTYMRCPGESETLFALESALDELACALGMDPIALRLRNDAQSNPETGQPWSSKSLRACYERGAELFGWVRRNPAPGSMRDGAVCIGMGMASALYPAYALPAAAEVSMAPDGIATVRSAATDIGPGTATALTQIAADALGIPVDRVRCEIGDSRFARAPQQGGSMIAASVGSAVHAAALELRRQAIAFAIADQSSPLLGVAVEAIEARDGLLRVAAAPSRCDSYEALLTRSGQDRFVAEATSRAFAQRLGRSCMAFGAQFAEVHVDMDLRTIRVPRLVGVFGVGRVINPKLVNSQLMGGMIWGLSQALLEETVYDYRLNRIVNASLADYLLPVNADVQSVVAECLPEDDPYVNPLGVKGVGEIGMAGVAPAIANAVHHATGIRVRELPITIEKLL